MNVCFSTCVIGEVNVKIITVFTRKRNETGQNMSIKRMRTTSTHDAYFFTTSFRFFFLKERHCNKFCFYFQAYPIPTESARTLIKIQTEIGTVVHTA